MAVAGEGFAKIGVRIGSAMVFGIVFLAAVLFGGVWGLGILLAAAAALGGWELTRLMRAPRVAPAVLAAVSAAAVVLTATVGTGTLESSLAGLLSAAGTFAAVLIAALVWLTVAKTSSAEGLAGILASAVWIGFGLAHLVLLRGIPQGGQPLVVLTVLGVWAGDVAAYVVGVSIGRHKLAPRLSPGKSWEGFLGGVVATSAVWVFLGPLLQVPLVTWAFVVVGVISAAFGLLGDLAESRMKRLAGVKDSGTMMPGHGGVLDRLDSLMIVAVALFWLAVLAGFA